MNLNTQISYTPCNSRWFKNANDDVILSDSITFRPIQEKLFDEDGEEIDVERYDEKLGDTISLYLKNIDSCIGVPQNLIKTIDYDYTISPKKFNTTWNCEVPLMVEIPEAERLFDEDGEEIEIEDYHSSLMDDYIGKVASQLSYEFDKNAVQMMVDQYLNSQIPKIINKR